MSAAQLASRVGRLIRLLRAHGLLAKIRGSHRYRITAKAHKIITAVLCAADASVPKLLELIS